MQKIFDLFIYFIILGSGNKRQKDSAGSGLPSEPLYQYPNQVQTHVQTLRKRTTVLYVFCRNLGGGLETIHLVRRACVQDGELQVSGSDF